MGRTGVEPATPGSKIWYRPVHQRPLTSIWPQFYHSLFHSSASGIADVHQCGCQLPVPPSYWEVVGKMSAIPIRRDLNQIPPPSQVSAGQRWSVKNLLRWKPSTWTTSALPCRWLFLCLTLLPRCYRSVHPLTSATPPLRVLIYSMVANMENCFPRKATVQKLARHICDLRPRCFNADPRSEFAHSN